ncbi:zinc ribbon domain-containing protein [Microcoleus sp. EPA2]|uniref:zinc ribbon domain-containing protein n=1 Tax=Microcoleus sp. EPA2 TaxID=2841654 RepID=UPI00312BC6D0
MSAWVNMLRSHYNWCLNDRIVQYNQQFIQGDYCDIKTRGEASPLTCFVSKSGATGNPWKDSKSDKEGNTRNPRRSATDIQITALPELNLILKIEYLAAKQGKVVIKVNPKYSSQKCRSCGHIDQSNRDGEKFICVECGYHEHADIGAAKTIRDRALEIVRGDSAKLGACHLNAQKISPRSKSKRGEFGNLGNKDIKTEMS